MRKCWMPILSKKNHIRQCAMALQISPPLGQPIYPFQEASNSTRQQPSLASPTSAPFFSFNYGFQISFLIKSLISSIYQDSLTLAISLLDFPLTTPKSNNVFSSLLIKKKKKRKRKNRYTEKLNLQRHPFKIYVFHDPELILCYFSPQSIWLQW